MDKLRVFSSDGELKLATDKNSEIQAVLADQGVRFEQWQADFKITEDATQEDILKAYQADIQKLKDQGGYQTSDVISLSANHPDKEALRQKFLSEHTHSEDEVRFFVRGSGLFTLHIKDQVFTTLCQQGDLISVPAGTPHWFDMGSNPEFTCIRLFTNPEGWVAQYTGSDIAQSFPRMEN